jgi:hypothetical protein
MSPVAATNVTARVGGALTGGAHTGGALTKACHQARASRDLGGHSAATSLAVTKHHQDPASLVRLLTFG